MHAKALVPILAEIFGVQMDTAFVIDRALAENGFRAKAKGRALPDMTRKEAVAFLIACMCNAVNKGTKATRVHEDVATWAAAFSELRVTYRKTFVDEFAALGHEPTEEDLSATDYDMDRSDNLPFLRGLHGETVSLFDYLLHVMSGIDRMHELEDMTLSLSPSHFEASVNIHLGFGRYDTETFLVDNPLNLSHDSRIRTDISVDGTFLAAIAVRTTDPLGEAR